MRRGFMIVGAAAACALAFPPPVEAGGGCYQEPGPDLRGERVELYMNCMSPGVLRTDVGKTVTFVNRDEIVHNVTGARWASDELRGGATFAHTFASAGTYPFSCTFHPGMIGAVVVGDGLGAATAVQPVSQSASAAAVTPVSASADKTTDRLPLGLALGAAAGVAATMVGRRIRTATT